MSDEVRFIDTTLRDGNQSLWALNMKIGAMLPAAEHMDHAGFSPWSSSSASCSKYVREHKENPWYWLREGTKRFKKTRLRYHSGMHSAFEKTPHCILKYLLVERLVAYGLTLTRTSNYGTTTRPSKEEIADLKETGMDTVANPNFTPFRPATRTSTTREGARSGCHQAVAHLLQRRRGLLTNGRTLIPCGPEERRRDPCGMRTATRPGAA
jgi:hypothetical protein